MVQCFTKPGNYKQIYKQSYKPKLVYACYVNKEQPIRALHSHKDVFEIIIITGGKGKVIFSNEQYELSAGNLIIVNEGVVHEEISYSATPISSLTLGINNLKLGSLPKNHLIKTGILPVYDFEENFMLYKSLFETAYNQLYYEKPDSNAICDSITDTVINLVMQDIGEGMQTTQTSDLIVARAKNYIEDNFSEELTLDIVAKELHVSKYYLSRLFKSYAGYSLNQYIKQLRIGEAQNLLINTNYSIAKIGERVGIDNPSYFNSIFTKVVGIQPLKYRNQSKKKTTK